MFKVVFFLGICVFEFYTYFMFLDNFLQQKERSPFIRKRFPLIILAALLLFAINIVPISYLFNAAGTALIIVAASCLLYRCNPFVRIVMALMCVGIGAASEAISVFGGTAFLSNGIDSMEQSNLTLYTLTIVSKLVQLCIIRLIISLFPQKKAKQEIRELRPMTLFPLMAIVSTYFMYYLDVGHLTHKIEHSVILLLGAGWLVLSIACIKIYSSALEKYDLAHKLKVAELERQAEVAYFRQHGSNEEHLRNILHDIKNQLLTIRGLFTLEPEEARMCMDELIRSLHQAKKLPVTADYGNEVVNFIINRHQQICLGLGIELKTKIEYDDLSFISFMDASSILDNALDNAEEACSQVPREEHRFISLHIFKQRESLIIIISNSKLSGSIIRMGDKLISTKANPQEHGFGIENIKSAAANYQGVVTVRDEGDVFSLIVSLNFNC